MGTEEKETFDSGAVREKKKDLVRYDLITPIGLRRLAETYGEGSIKYGDRNWEKGIPVSNLMNHLIDHINKYNVGDRSEDHLAHAAWGLFAIMHFEEIKMKNDYEVIKCTCKFKQLADYFDGPFDPNCPVHNRIRNAKPGPKPPLNPKGYLVEAYDNLMNYRIGASKEIDVDACLTNIAKALRYM